MAYNKSTRQSVKPQVQDSPKDSPKSTVKVALLDKTKENKNSDIATLFKQAGEGKVQDSDLNSFKEEMKSMMQKMNNTISTKFESLDTKFTGLFNDFKSEMSILRNEVRETKRDIERVSDKVGEIERSLEFQIKTVADNEEKHLAHLSKVKAEIEVKLQDLNRKLLIMEKQDRKYNLLFYGFAEEERGENLFDKMRTVFVEDLGIDQQKVENMYFAHGHRMPAEGQEGPRPLIMRFSSYEDRELVLSKAFKLAGSRRRILPDLPVIMKKERGRLAKEAFNIRKREGLQTRIRDRGLEVLLEVRKERSDQWVKRVVSGTELM